mgnify:CR=1 FL=1
MSISPKFTESYEVHVKTKTIDRCLRVDASPSEPLQNGEKSSFLKNSAILELKKLGIEINMMDLTNFSYKKLKP